MSANKDVSHAQNYHESTKHSEISIRMSGHYLDWENKPEAFKKYLDLPSLPLPRDFPAPAGRALDAVSMPAQEESEGRLNLTALSQILFFSAGITRVVSSPYGTYHMRAAPATGALYPIELYVVSGDVEGLKPGVYHFNPLEFALTQLREGDYLGALAAVSSERIAEAPVTIAFTSFAWRNAWKYEARSYRHWFWDSGVITANLLAIASSLRLRTKLSMGFIDSKVNQLLCVDTKKEAAIVLAAIGTEKAQSVEKEITKLRYKVKPLSQSEVQYPIVWETHRASSLQTAEEVNGWLRASTVDQEPVAASSRGNFQLKAGGDSASLGDAILSRGSTRRFAKLPIAFEQLSAVLKASASEVPLDFLKAGGSLIDIYLIANAVEGLPSGGYFFNRKSNSLELLKEGQLRSVSGYLCLEQPLFSDASVVFYIMTNLDNVLKAFGNRGYRASQFEGGVTAGKIYLSAYAQGIGASGSTFYDDAVTEFFSPHAQGRSTIITVGIGVPDYKARPGTILPQLK